MPLKIRAASPKDAAQLAELSGQLGYPAQPEEMKQRLARVQPDEEHALFVAEQQGGGVAGWVHVFLYHSIENATRAEVGGLVVDERNRSQGLEFCFSLEHPSAVLHFAGFDAEVA